MSVKRPSKFLYKPSPLCKEHGLSKHILLLVYIYRYWRDRWTAVEATRQLLSRQTMRKETTENELVEIFLLLLLLLLLLVFILHSSIKVSWSIGRDHTPRLPQNGVALSNIKQIDSYALTYFLLVLAVNTTQAPAHTNTLQRLSSGSLRLVIINLFRFPTASAQHTRGAAWMFLFSNLT